MKLYRTSKSSQVSSRQKEKLEHALVFLLVTGSHYYAFLDEQYIAAILAVVSQKSNTEKRKNFRTLSY